MIKKLIGNMRTLLKKPGKNKYIYISNRYTTRNRNTVISILFFFLFVILTTRLGYLQIVKGDAYAKMAREQTTRIISLKAPRGVIFDRNGEVLAGNRTCFNVDVYQMDLLKGNANKTILTTVEILERYGDAYANNIPIRMETDPESGGILLLFDWETGSKEQLPQEALNWLKLYNFSRDITAVEALNKLSDLYSIEDSYSMEEKLKILSIWNEIRTAGYHAYYPVTISRDISTVSAAVLEESISELPGISVTPSYVRYYPNGNLASHVLGYMGVITAEDWASNKEYYISNGYNPVTDLIGRWEMEYVLEPYLRGKDGGQRVLVDVSGRNLGVMETLEPIPGHDVYLTLDLRLQRTAERALTAAMEKIRNGGFGKAYPNAFIGSVVAVDVNTGAILVLVNKPDYDPNAFATGKVDARIWEELNPSYPDPRNPERKNLDPTLPRPMVNNAVRGIFPPGSIFKMIVGLAGLEEGRVSPDGIIFDRGRYTKYSNVNSPACWIWNMYKATHGQVDIISGLRDSCNYFFYELGDRLGIETIEDYAYKFGLGKRTGIELPYEAEGIVAGPDHINSYIRQIVRNRILNLKGISWQEAEPELRKKISDGAKRIVENNNISFIEKELGKLGITLSRDRIDKLFYSYIRDAGWSPSKTLSASIGQAENTFSPIQMASYLATLSNGGTRYKCYLTDRIISRNGETIKRNTPEVLERIKIKPENHEAIMLGMRAVTSSVYNNIPGTGARYFNNFDINVAGKTGSAQFPGRDSYGWFVACAPYENPEIAVAVMVGQAGSGGYVAEVAREVFREYFRQRGINIPSLQRNQLSR